MVANWNGEISVEHVNFHSVAVQSEAEDAAKTATRRLRRPGAAAPGVAVFAPRRPPRSGRPRSGNSNVLLN